jgi:hypothetical protein
MQRTEPSTTNDPVEVEGIAAFVEQLDALARRRPRNGPRLPTILVVGAYADRLVSDYDARLTIEGRRTVPHILHDCSTEDPAPGPATGNSPLARTHFLDRVADQLAGSLPTGARGMRSGRDLGLPRYRTVSRIVDARPKAKTEAGGTTRSIVTHPIEETDAPVPEAPVEGAPDPVRVGSSDELAQQVCSSLGPRDIVFYTSRSQEFVSFLQSMHDDADCPDRFTVVGGSALTKIVEDPSNPLPQYEGVSLYYAAFASQSVSYNAATDEFMRLYQEAYGEDVVAPDISDGAVAYDAFNALQRTANYAIQSDLPISADTSAGALGGEEIEFDGASGYIARGNGPLASTSPRVPPEKPVLVLAAGEGSAANTLACGRYAKDVGQRTWGAAETDCPTVN